VYSVSDTARSELPSLPPERRSAVSIARRLQDPLSELIKIDVRSIGVGMYQVRSVLFIFFIIIFWFAALRTPLTINQISPSSLLQHDVSEKALATAVDSVVERCVSHVGVDLNSASATLLTHCAGVGTRVAANVVAHRRKHGRFATRAALRDVAGIGGKTFEQCAAFVRVRDGDNWLDATGA
jgi:uncharacterized protein